MQPSSPLFKRQPDNAEPHTLNPHPEEGIHLVLVEQGMLLLVGTVAPQLRHSLQGRCSLLLAGDALEDRQQASLVCRQAGQLQRRCCQQYVGMCSQSAVVGGWKQASSTVILNPKSLLAVRGCLQAEMGLRVLLEDRKQRTAAAVVYFWGRRMLQGGVAFPKRPAAPTGKVCQALSRMHSTASEVHHQCELPSGRAGWSAGRAPMLELLGDPSNE